jgi:putative spermidine/putrescine transport system permease protein
MFSRSFYPKGLEIFSLDNYFRFFTTPFFYGNFLKTLEIAAVVTALTLILGYPVAYYISKSRRFQGLLMLLIFFPVLISTVIQSFGFMIVLGRSGAVNNILIGLGLISDPLPLLYNMNGIIIGLTQHLLPYMILPLLASLVNIDNSLVEAAKNLGAGRIRIFLTVIFPLSLPGVFAGASIVITGSIAMFVIPSLLGGAEKVMSVMVAEYILNFANVPMAATISLIMLITTVAIIFISTLLITRTKYRGVFQ